jgi:hypothetical protein
MSLNDFTAEIEAEITWREDEMQMLSKALLIQPDPVHDRLRKTMIVMMYSHLEGFTKFALLHYLAAVNKRNLPLEEASYCIAAAAASALFKDLRDPNRKSEHFRSSLPDDTSLHRFARDRHFIDEYDKHIAKSSISISDAVIDMDSNLKPEVLSKNLFRLGLPFQLSKSIQGNLTILLNHRNKIAHGEMRSGVDSSRFQLCKKAFDETIKYVKSTLIAAYRDEAYLKAKSYY